MNTLHHPVGSWRLKSAVMEDVETGNRLHAWGEHPKGSLVLTPSGHWIVLQTAEHRPSPGGDLETASAFRSMLAYSGRFRIEGDQIAIEGDIAWDETWIGREQIRIFRLSGDELHIEAPPQRYANFNDRLMRGILIWQRET
jgi:Lipocalin-like domain